MDIFEYTRQKMIKKESPLAARIRPKTLEEFVGQEHIIGKDKLLYRAIKADQLSSLIFYGPPGTGKTTLAKIIAHTTTAHFRQVNAVVAGKKELVEIMEEAKMNQGMTGRKTILFIDEIHRFNKAQQDALLPAVEDGTIVLIGATTENPYFEVNRALVSRSQIFHLKPLEKQHIKTLLFRSIKDVERGLGSYNVSLSEEAANFLAEVANGDARTALNALELGVLTTERNQEGKIEFTLKVAEECIQKRAIQYDKTGDNHYDTISAFIKSIRGSDPDAAIYYLARMLEAGEDPRFIARRIVIAALEDVGNADPMALQMALAAAQAVDFIGMPEGRIILSQAVAYVATAPKSNASYLAIDAALQDVREVTIQGIPNHLRDAHYDGAKKLGHGIEYLYPHDYPNHYVEQQYLPSELLGRKYYCPTDQGYEEKIKNHQQKNKEANK